MRAYNRLWGNINTLIKKRRVDCLHKEAVSEHNNMVGIIESQIDIAVAYLNEAITRMEQK